MILSARERGGLESVEVQKGLCLSPEPVSQGEDGMLCVLYGGIVARRHQERGKGTCHPPS